MSRGFYGRVGVFYTDEITENLAKIGKAVRPMVVNAVLLAAEVVREKAYGHANVSPGIVGHGVDGSHMRDRIEVTLIEEPESVQAKVGVDMSIIPYAAHQEFGPRGKPYLRPAIDESRQECHDIMASVLIDGKEPHTLVRFRRFA